MKAHFFERHSLKTRVMVLVLLIFVADEVNDELGTRLTARELIAKQITAEFLGGQTGTRKRPWAWCQR